MSTINEYDLIKKLGHISKTSKMPCYSWSRSAFDCKYTDPICLKYCYARKHHYNFKNVKEALAINKEKWKDPEWVKNFEMFLKYFINAQYFRWFDSGDLNGDIELFTKICEIADRCPKILFWLPTRDKEVIKEYVKNKRTKRLDELHPNLIIRLSASDVDKDPNYKFAKKHGLRVSSVRKFNSDCQAKITKTCGTCRKCWDRNVKEVRYYLH